jgi:hypothetical protein
MLIAAISAHLSRGFFITSGASECGLGLAELTIEPARSPLSPQAPAFVPRKLRWTNYQIRQEFP